MEAMSEALKRAGLLSPKQEEDLNNLEAGKKRKKEFDQELMCLRDGSNNQEKKLTSSQKTIVDELVLNYIAPIKIDPCTGKVSVVIAELGIFRKKHEKDREWIKAIDALIGNLYILKLALHWAQDENLQERKKVVENHKFPNFTFVF